jgi:sortase (surface protein transpeptidase)
MKGNAVVAGHLDSQTGPAVFYRLGDLQPGDEITVVTHDGEELRFAVTGVESFDANSAPLYNIFGASSSANLNLITCEGSFDPNARQYDKRLVVYSTLVTG